MKKIIMPYFYQYFPNGDIDKCKRTNRKMYYKCLNRIRHDLIEAIDGDNFLFDGKDLPEGEPLTKTQQFLAWYEDPHDVSELVITVLKQIKTRYMYLNGPRWNCEQDALIMCYSVNGLDLYIKVFIEGHLPVVDIHKKEC